MVKTSSSVSNQLYFDVAGLRLSAKRYGKKGGQPILALHGWMDNCASFEVLAPQLIDCDVVCIDCAGHGNSDHRPHLGAYNIWQDVAELFSIADQLDWPTFALLGHSRGGMCAFLAAGTLPKRISHLMLVEGVYPILGAEEDAANILTRAVEALLTVHNRPKRYYTTFEQAVKARANGFIPLGMAEAKVLAQHGTEKTSDGYSWRYDYKLTIGSEVRLTYRQILAFQKNIQAKTLVILAEQGLLIDNKEVHEALEHFHQASIITLPGDHHLHMQSKNNTVSQCILKHFATE